MTRRVLILCTGNSCRSQLAEALVNHDLADSWQAFSAGTQPAGYVHPLALRVLEETGIQHLGCSKSVDVFQGQAFDAVITVCAAAAENCPVWLGKGLRTHIAFPDPAQAEGSPEQVLEAFRSVRDAIRAQIIPYLLTLSAAQALPDPQV
jgi:arsenate reductase (thioredoxin)